MVRDFYFEEMLNKWRFTKSKIRIKPFVFKISFVIGEVNS